MVPTREAEIKQHLPYHNQKSVPTRDACKATLAVHQAQLALVNNTECSAISQRAGSMGICDLFARPWRSAPCSRVSILLTGMLLSKAGLREK
jgi:hypothetical protein